MKQLIAGAAALCFVTSAAYASDGRGVAFASKSVIEGAQEVIDNNGTLDNGSPGLGNAVIRFSRNYKRAFIKVTFSALEGEFTRLHLHCNVAGANGPIALGVVDLVAIEQDNSEVATLDSNTVIGRFRNRQLPADGGACGISTLGQLASEINNGRVYFNLHTTAFPAGELRGQVEPLERVHVRVHDQD